MIFNLHFIIALITMTLSFAVVFFISTARSHLIYSCFTKIPFANVVRASLAGNFYGLFNVPLLGNLLGQNHHFEKINIPVSLSSLIMIMERALLLGAGLVLLIILVCWRHTDFHLESYQNLIISLLEIGGVFTFVAIATLGRSIGYSKITGYLLKHKTTLAIVFLTNLIQWVVLTFCFAIGPYMIAGQEWSIYLFVTAFMCSMLSSLPINVAGFGLREVVCIFLFGTLNIGTALALELSICIGVCSIAAICILFITRGTWLSYFQSQKFESWTYPVEQKDYLESILLKGILLLMSIMILFQLHYIADGYSLNLNLADPLALIGCVYLIMAILKKEKTDFPLGWIACIMTALVVGFLTSLFKIGFTPFAFINKLFGFIIVTGYAYVGYLGVKTYGKEILKTVIRFQVIGFSIICAWKLFALIFVQRFQTLKVIFFPHNEFEGFCQDRNSFGFSMLIVLSMYAIIKRYLNESKAIFSPWLIGFLWFSLYFSNSRTAYVTSIIIIFYLLFTSVINLRDLITTIICATLFSLVVHYGHDFINYIQVLIGASENKIKKIRTLHDYSGEGSLQERMISIYEGLRLFKENWFLGAGLGAFKKMWIETRGHPLIIHNSYVWVLAEMGLLGAGLIFTKPLMWGWTLLKAHVKQYRQKEVFPFGQILFFALLVIFALFALPQDVFYQRLFWFWFGLSSAVYFPTLTLRKNT